MSNAEEERILETPDRKAEGEEPCHTFKQYRDACLDEMKEAFEASV
jgi:hypothetical protein